MAEVIDFPEQALRQGLSKMPIQKVVAFSCSCAEILMPSYVEFSRKFDPDEHRHRLFRHALNLSWDIALGSPFNVDDLAVLQDQGLNAIPSEDEFPEIEGAYAEDAGAAVVFCLRVAMSEDVQDAIWAARRVYDALDGPVRNFVFEAYSCPKEDVCLANRKPCRPSCR